MAVGEVFDSEPMLSSPPLTVTTCPIPSAPPLVSSSRPLLTVTPPVKLFDPDPSRSVPVPDIVRPPPPEIALLRLSVPVPAPVTSRLLVSVIRLEKLTVEGALNTTSGAIAPDVFRKSSALPKIE